MRKVLDFLRELRLNNTKAWFDAHRDIYAEARSTFERMVDSVIEDIREFDGSIGDLKARDCMYRIYRDTRFSSDKSPYKTHFGAFIAPGGRKSGYSGYYIHVGNGCGDSYPDAHMLAIGNYYQDRRAVQIIREDIMMGDLSLPSAVSKADPRLSLDTDSALRRVPSGFPRGTDQEIYYRLRTYCLSMGMTNSEVTSADIRERITTVLRSAAPFLAVVNRAIGYVDEQEGGIRC